MSRPAAETREYDLQRSRRKHVVEATILSPKISKRARSLAALAEALEEEEAPVAHIQRPRTRAECEGGARPCPFVGCRYSLFLDVNPKTGSIKLNFPDLEPSEMLVSCVLDVAADGGETLEKLGELLNITRERARQLEGMALVKIRQSRFGDFADVELPAQSQKVNP